MAKEIEEKCTANIYFDKDVEIKIIKNKTIGVIGYGNQGRAEALNLRDSGLNIIIGNIEDDYKKLAEKDGFKVYPIADATEKSDIIMILIPDEIQSEVFNRDILPNLRKHMVLNFATGYNIAFQDITKLIPPNFVDVIMIAPRMIGVGVRDLYLKGEGFYSFIAVHQDSSGNARQILLELAKALGTMKKGAIETTFYQEAVLDLFTEQAFGPAFGQVLSNSIKCLIEAGYPPEAVFVELYMSGELSFTIKEMAETGIINQMDFHSPTSQYGSLTRGANFIDLPLMEKMQRGLKQIESGKFAKEWARVQKKGMKSLGTLKESAKKYFVSSFEKVIRKKLKLD
ncbi:MAG: ketol-acid reductoisomerase [Candidatus Helarchaeota archaeon]|nr:ketol-acid reductoisomerase [Candidatus Helarchaeota archaeon]